MCFQYSQIMYVSILYSGIGLLISYIVLYSALICLKNAPRIPKKNFHALTRLDENRAKCQVCKFWLFRFIINVSWYYEHIQKILERKQAIYSIHCFTLSIPLTPVTVLSELTWRHLIKGVLVSDTLMSRLLHCITLCFYYLYIPMNTHTVHI
jgi:hypothetical protein